MANIRDPFYAVKDKVVTSLQQANQQYTQYQRTKDATQANTIKQQCKDIQVDVNDLAQTITIVEMNRSKFVQIDDAELQSRQSFVNQTRQQLQSMLASVNSSKAPTSSSSSSAAPAAGNTRKQLSSRGNNNGIELQDSRSRTVGGGGDPLAGARDQQQMVERQQDEALDDMTSALDRLQNLAGDINTEIKTQDVMLSELDSELDEAGGTMQRTLKRLDKLLKTSDKGRLGCIAILFVIALALLFIIIYS